MQVAANLLIPIFFKFPALLVRPYPRPGEAGLALYQSANFQIDLTDIDGNRAPPLAEKGMLTCSDGVRLRVARWSGRDLNKGTVCIFPGLGEFIEKYFETIGELLGRGFGVTAMDWRGQGRSDRMLGNRSKAYVKNFRHYRHDLVAFEEQWLEPYCGKPWFALGHSMGGAILLDWAGRGQSPFERLVLTAPMISLASGVNRSWLAMIVKILNLAGLGRFYIPGIKRGSPMKEAFAGNALTGDKARFMRMGEILRAAPDLEIGAPTIAWAAGAIGLMRGFDDLEFIRQIRDPILILASGNDHVVDSEAAEILAGRLKSGSCIALQNARHEILAERDFLRAQFWAAFDAFITIPAGELRPAEN